MATNKARGIRQEDVLAFLPLTFYFFFCLGPASGGDDITARLTKEERKGKREKRKMAITKPGGGRKETFLLSYLLLFIFSFAPWPPCTSSSPPW